MSRYATELLDGFEQLYKRTDTTVDSLGDISAFLKKLSIVQSDYSKELKKLVKTAQKGGKSVDAEIGTFKSSWDVILNQLDVIADFHNKFSTVTVAELSTNIANYQKDREKERKRLMLEGGRLTKEVSEVMGALARAKKNYQLRCEEMDKAQATYLKAKADSSIKPKELNKCASKSTQANDRANSADKEYQMALKTANQRQQKFYESEMPKLLDDFQKFEEDRVSFLKGTFEKFTSAHSEFPGVFEKISESMTQVVNAIDKDADTKTWLQANRTGKSVPPPIEYEPYVPENGPPPSSSGASSPPPGVTAGARPITMMGSVSAKPKPAEAPKQVGLSAADEGLSPTEKQAKLEAQIAELRKTIRAQIKQKKGLEKLAKFYANDPVARDKAQGEAEDIEKKIHSLKENRKTIEKQISDVTGQPYQSTDDDDDGEEEEDGPKGAAPNSGANSNGVTQRATFIPNAAAAPAKTETPSSTAPTVAPTETGGPVVKYRALYDYEATNDNELSFNEGDILHISEQDDSGWWFAEVDGRTGFIPNNYVQPL